MNTVSRRFTKTEGGSLCVAIVDSRDRTGVLPARTHTHTMKNTHTHTDTHTHSRTHSERD